MHLENTWDGEDNLGDELGIYQQHSNRQYLNTEVGSLPLGSTQTQITFCHPFHKLFLITEPNREENVTKSMYRRKNSNLLNPPFTY